MKKSELKNLIKQVIEESTADIQQINMNKLFEMNREDMKSLIKNLDSNTIRKIGNYISDDSMVSKNITHYLFNNEKSNIIWSNIIDNLDEDGLNYLIRFVSLYI